MLEPPRKITTSFVRSSSGIIDYFTTHNELLSTLLIMVVLSRAKQLFKENAEQVESMIGQLGYKIKKDYLHSI